MVTESYPGYSIICHHCVFTGSSRPNPTCSQCPQAPGSLFRFEMENIEPHTFYLCGGRSMHRQQLSSKIFPPMHLLQIQALSISFIQLGIEEKKVWFGVHFTFSMLFISQPKNQPLLKLKPEESNPDVLCNLPGELRLPALAEYRWTTQAWSLLWKGAWLASERSFVRQRFSFPLGEAGISALSYYVKLY